ncbi:MAG TPA: hypothetical protein VGS22_07285 [Thermoanaerobaculia bacterium]|jgi:hypothetical protein|nr:hypothetical protein [Thermoanaerobaculia bacterium]
MKTAQSLSLGTLATLAALLTFSFLARPSFALDPVRKITEEFQVGSAPKIQTKLKSGDLIVQGWDGPNVQAEINLGCLEGTPADVCRKATDGVSLAWSRTKNQVLVRVKGATGYHARKLWIEARFKVPAHVPLEVESVNGEVQISGMLSDVEADSGGGDITITQSKATVGPLHIDVGAGKAELWVSGGKIEGSGLLRSINWTGTGTAKIEVDLGAGDAVVRLD